MVNNHGDIIMNIFFCSNVTLWKPWSFMVNHGPMLHCDKDCLYVKINHGTTSHCDKYCLNMKIDNGQPWSNVTLWQRLCEYENNRWSMMDNHVYFRVYNIYSNFALSHILYIKINHGQLKSTMVNMKINHRQTWLATVQHHIVKELSQHENQLWSSIVDHGQPCFNVTFFRRLSQCENQPWWIIVNYGQPWSVIMFTLWRRLSLCPMSHCDKENLNMIINHVQSSSTMAIHCQTWSNITL